MAVTVKDNSVQSINSALLRASKGGSGTTVKNVQNVTNVNQTTEIVKLADGTTLDIKGLRQTNSLLTGQIAELERQLKLLKSQVENIGLSSKDSGKTLVFSNYLDVDSETTVPVVVAQYSANGLDWHDTFVEGQDIYIRFSYDAGGEWTDPIKIVGEDGSSYAYYGLVYNYDSMPSDSTGNFFLCGQDFNGYGRLLINNSQLILNENYILSVTRKFQKGYIYVYDGFIWQRLDDKNNFRYVIAMNDLIEIDEPLSPGFIEQFQSSIVVYTPKYLGGFAAAPITAHNGDTFCYTGTTTANYTKGMCYKWADGTGWSVLSTTDPENAQAYMSALNDILQNTSDNGTFAAVFAQHICSNSAFIKNLAAQIITLQNGGIIQSSNRDKPIISIKYKTDSWSETYDGSMTLTAVSVSTDNWKTSETLELVSVGYAHLTYQISDSPIPGSTWNSITSTINVPIGKYLFLHLDLSHAGVVGNKTIGPYLQAYKGFSIDYNGDAEFNDAKFKGNLEILGNAQIQGTFNSIKGYRYNNLLSFIEGSLNLRNVIDAIKVRFPDYLGKMHCYAELFWIQSSRIFRGYAISLEIGADTIILRGYGGFTNSAVYNFMASITSSDLWLVVGTENYHNIESETTLEIYY